MVFLLSMIFFRSAHPWHSQKRRSELSGPWQIMCWQLQIWVRELIKRRRLPNDPECSCGAAAVAHRWISGAVGLVARPTCRRLKDRTGQNCDRGSGARSSSGWLVGGQLVVGCWLNLKNKKLTGVDPLMGLQMGALGVHFGAACKKANKNGYKTEKQQFFKLELEINF